MRLLIVTQAVDTEDSALGFFHRWIDEFAKHCESVEVICLREGAHTLPAHVHIHSLGKEGGRSRVKYVTRFYRYIWTLRHSYDVVFVHMNPEYVVLGGLVWRVLGKKIGLWYVHRSVQWWLRVAAALSNVLFTSAPQSLRVESKKIVVIGHAIDVQSFATPAMRPIDPHRITLVSLGRITPIKNLDTVLEAMVEIERRGIRVSLDLIGETVMAYDFAYEKTLKARAKELGVADGVQFRGAMAHRDIAKSLGSYDISVNASPTGGVDKTVLESIMCGVAVVVSNRAFESFLGEASRDMFFNERNATDLADTILRIAQMKDLDTYKKQQRAVVVQKSDITAIVPRILSFYGSGS